MPVVSVVMPSFNHAQFILKAINSVLSQTVLDIELVIVDDGSSDDTVNIIRSVRDERIKFIPLESNVGACAAMNIAISHCEADLIAVCNSDDLWEHNKVELQLNLLEARPNIGAVFSDVLWIDDRDAVLDGASKPVFEHVFKQANRSRYAWIRKLIEDGNCLCHPSVLIRKSVYIELGTYDNYYRQLPDLEMWIRVVQNYDIHVMNEKLVRFRIHDKNTSKIDLNTIRRTWQEHRMILREFFEKVTKDNFLRAFGAQSPRAFSSSRPRDFVDEKVDYLLGHAGHFSSIFRDQALEIIHSNRQSADGQLMRDLDFHNLTATFDAPHEPSPKDLEIARLLAETERLPEITLAAQAVQQAAAVEIAELRLSAEYAIRDVEVIRASADREIRAVQQAAEIEMAKLRLSTDESRREVEVIRASTSWKITRPLRLLFTALRGG